MAPPPIGAELENPAAGAAAPPIVAGPVFGAAISGIGGKATFARPVVNTRFGTAAGWLWVCIRFSTCTRCCSERSLGFGDFGPPWNVSFRDAV